MCRPIAPAKKSYGSKLAFCWAVVLVLSSKPVSSYKITAIYPDDLPQQRRNQPSQA